MDEGTFLFFKSEEDVQNHKEGRYHKKKYDYLQQAGVKEEVKVENKLTKKSQQ